MTKTIARFIIEHHHQCPVNGYSGIDHETLDVDCPELVAALNKGGSGENGYSIRKLVGVELIEQEK